jgi:hypothetical protein
LRIAFYPAEKMLRVPVEVLAEIGGRADLQNENRTKLIQKHSI